MDYVISAYEFRQILIINVPKEATKHDVIEKCRREFSPHSVQLNNIHCSKAKPWQIDYYNNFSTDIYYYNELGDAN